MNIVLFISALILALSLLTYGKWEAYRNLHIVESQFKNYMEKKERSGINLAAERWYGNVVIQSKEGKPQTKAEGSSRLSFKPFIDKETKAKFQKEFPQLHYLAKKLINALYFQAPFYRHLVQEDPAAVDKLLDSLMIADQLPKEKKLKVAKDLNTLHLANPTLDDFLYKLLKGAQDPFEKSHQVLPPLQHEESDDAPETNLTEEHRSPVGYYSLLDHITLQPTAKIRVFLASKYLLSAIFDDPQTIDEIIAERQRLYQLVVGGHLEAKAATQQFEGAFLGRIDRNLNKLILDFTVTKTNPKNYQ